MLPNVSLKCSLFILVLYVISLWVKLNMKEVTIGGISSPFDTVLLYLFASPKAYNNMGDSWGMSLTRMYL